MGVQGRLDEDTREKLALAEALERLSRNEDFKLVVMKGYLEKEPLRLTTMLCFEDKNRQSIYDQLLSISNLRYYLSRVEDEGYSIAQYLKECEEGNEE